MEYAWTAGIENGIRYDRDGKALGFAPITGSPSGIIGGPLSKGDKAIKLGKYLLNPKAYHLVKTDFLAQIGRTSFAHIVGKNPDISFSGMKIILTGTKSSPMQGKHTKQA